MKLTLNQTYVNLELLKAEVSGRGRSTRKLERVWIFLCVVLFFVLLSPIILVTLKTNWILPKEYQEIKHNKIIAHSSPVAQVDDDELYLTPRPLTETLMYSLSQHKEAVKMSELKGVPIDYKYDSRGKLILYNVTYPINIIVNSYSNPN